MKEYTPIDLAERTGRMTHDQATETPRNKADRPREAEQLPADEGRTGGTGEDRGHRRGGDPSGLPAGQGRRGQGRLIVGGWHFGI